jgi:hypothetical protein
MPTCVAIRTLQVGVGPLHSAIFWLIERPCVEYRSGDIVSSLYRVGQRIVRVSSPSGVGGVTLQMATEISAVNYLADGGRSPQTSAEPSPPVVVVAPVACRAQAGATPMATVRAIWPVGGATMRSRALHPASRDKEAFAEPPGISLPVGCRPRMAPASARPAVYHRGLRGGDPADFLLLAAGQHPHQLLPGQDSLAWLLQWQRDYPAQSSNVWGVSYPNAGGKSS